MFTGLSEIEILVITKISNWERVYDKASGIKRAVSLEWGIKDTMCDVSHFPCFGYYFPTYSFSPAPPPSLNPPSV